MLEPKLIGTLAGPNAILHVITRPHGILRVCMADGIEVNLVPPMEEFVLQARSLARGVGLRLFPADVFEMDKFQAGLMDSQFKHVRKTLEAAWADVGQKCPHISLEERGASLIREFGQYIREQSKLPARYGPDRYERHSHSTDMVLKRFVRMKLFEASQTGEPADGGAAENERRADGI